MASVETARFSKISRNPPVHKGMANGTHDSLGCRAMAGENLDLTDGPLDGKPTTAKPCAESRRFVGVHFVCCDVYTRVYINRDATAYEGNCPKCAKRVRLRIGPGGTDARFFTAG